MKAKQLLLSTVCAVSCASVFADTTIKEKIKLHDMTCDTFISLGPNYHDKVVYWAAARAEAAESGNNANDVYIKIRSMDKLVPDVVEHCTKTPGTNFYETVKIKYKD